MSAHAKWLMCTNAFLYSKSECAPQTFVPFGYFFETGRELRISLAENETCDSIGDRNIYTVTGCKVKQGLTMVVPVVTTYYVAVTCDADNSNCQVEDPRVATANVWASTYHLVTATLNGENIDPLDLPRIVSQDGDLVFKADMSPTKCPNRMKSSDITDGYPLGASGLYAFIDTSRLKKGTHELFLIGEIQSFFCSAVKHVFEVV